MAVGVQKGVHAAQCCLLHLSFFLLYPVLTTLTPIVSVVPVMVVGWGYGFRGGLVGGLLMILLNSFLLNLAGYEPVGWDALVSREGGILGSLFVVLVGMVVGKMSDLTRQLQVTNKELETKITERKQAEDALRKSQESLLAAQEVAHFGFIYLGDLCFR